MRDPNHDNFLSKDLYHLDELIAFVAGNIYILSLDVVSFIQRNTPSSPHTLIEKAEVWLQPMGTLEDLSIALWLLSLQVYPVHLDGIARLKIPIDNEENILILTDFIATFNIKQPNQFYTIHDYICSESMRRNQRDSDLLSPKAMSVYVAPQAMYALHFIDVLMEKRFRKQRSFKYFAADFSQMVPVDTDVLVLSVNDAQSFDDDIDQFGPSRLHELARKIGKFRSSLVVLLCGEAVDMSGLGTVTRKNDHDLSQSLVDVLIVSSIRTDFLPSWGEKAVCRTVNCWDSSRIIYAPVIALAFAEMALSGSSWKPRELLIPRGYVWAQQQLLQKENTQMRVAYLYNRCTGGQNKFGLPMRELREVFFSLLKAEMVDQVVALGFCGGDGRTGEKLVDESGGMQGRFAQTYLQDAIEMYRPFKFVIAFENSDDSFYITEKILLPYLAAAVPIYLGAEEVDSIFNPRSFINCGTMKSLQECVERVVEVDRYDDMYIEMLSQQPIESGNKFRQLFSWLF